MTSVTSTEAPTTADETKRVAVAMARDLRRLRDQIAENESVAQAEIDGWNDWLYDQNTPLAERAATLETQLRLWLEGRLHDDPDRAKSESLRYVNIALRKGSLTYDIVDEAVALPLIEAAFPEAINRPEPKPPVPSIRKAELARLVKDGALRIDGDPEQPGVYKLVADTGEIVDGIVAVRSDETFSVEPT